MARTKKFLTFEVSADLKARTVRDELRDPAPKLAPTEAADQPDAAAEKEPKSEKPIG